MSYQLMEEMDCWEEDMDKLLIMLPIVGTVFKKTYWDSISQKNCSHLVLPKNLVVDYWAKSLKTAERISEILEINPRKVKERQMSGLWLDIDLDMPTMEDLQNSPNAPTEIDSTTPFQFIEQHTYLDLDKDDYKEPYIVTFHRASGKVVRIAANYDEHTMEFNSDGDLLKIDAIQYYTKFGFVPNPDGSFYDIGFGVLLGPLNESVNTLINQLVDAGTLNNLQSGFLGKGLRLRMGETRFQPGEWKVVNSTGDDLKKQIVPMPSKEPSNTLLELLQLLITSGKELASVAEIFVGKMPGQNTPATTTMASIEQGMKVFTAVYKRLYRSLAEEFDKLYRLNGLYLNPNEYQEVVGMTIGPDDFSGEGHKIIPGADPTAVSQTEKLMKAQGLMEMLATGMPLDPVKVMIRMLEAQEQPNWQELIPQQILQTGQMPPPPPDPKLLAVQAKTEADMAKTQAQVQAIATKAEIDKSSKEAQLAMKEQEHEQDMQHKMQMAEIEAVSNVQKQHIMNAQAQAQAVQSLSHAEQSHQQQMKHGEEQSAAKVQQTKAQAKAKPSKPTKGATKK
jgi:chaperonin GroES